MVKSYNAAAKIVCRYDNSLCYALTVVTDLISCWFVLCFECRTIDRRGSSFQIATDGCFGTKNEINYLEHVQAKVTLSYSRRGDLQLHLVAPSGTRSTLLQRRKDDFQAGKLDAWSFLSVFYWGEHPNGTWTLNAENVGSMLNSGNDNVSSFVYVAYIWKLLFYCCIIFWKSISFSSVCFQLHLRRQNQCMVNESMHCVETFFPWAMLLW